MPGGTSRQQGETSEATRNAPVPAENPYGEGAPPSRPSLFEYGSSEFSSIADDWAARR